MCADAITHRYWHDFYASSRKTLVPDDPSPFALWVAKLIKPSQPVLEFGFGTARDSLYFATAGHAVTGYDFAESAVDLANEKAGQRQLDARFQMLDLDSPPHIQVLTAAMQVLTVKPLVYGRFLLHSLTDEGRANLFTLLPKIHKTGCQFMFEFRTGEDADAEHVFGDDHFRQYLDPERVASELRGLGAVVEQLEVGYGMAVYKSEDPHVARLAGHFPPTESM